VLLDVNWVLETNICQMESFLDYVLSNDALDLEFNGFTTVQPFGGFVG
jgi:hypothetical protein